MPKVWLITGISRGLGHSLAKAVLAGNDLVIGHFRDPEGNVIGVAGGA